MIVKNEAHIIARALRSVQGIADYWVICDTGSTDDTPARILEAMAGIPGELHCVEWVNFGHNRTQVLQLAREKADYFLMMDADMTANIYGDFKRKLQADYYEIRYEGDLDYSQPMLVSGRHDWAYQGVTHEYIHAPTARTWSILPELTLSHYGDGGMRADKFVRDIRLLSVEAEKNPDDPRTVFYLAQSYKDLGQWAEALHWYTRRAALDEGWAEERWYARYQAANMRDALGRDWSAVLLDYLEVYAARPARLEPIYRIVRHYREAENYALGYLYSSVISAGLAYPNADFLFIEKPVYDYLLPLEHGVCAHGTGRMDEAIAAFEKVLECPALPDWVAESAERGRSMILAMI